MVIKDYYQQKHAPEGIDPDILETMLGSSIEPEAQLDFCPLYLPTITGWGNPAVYGEIAVKIPGDQTATPSMEGRQP